MFLYWNACTGRSHMVWIRDNTFGIWYRFVSLKQKHFKKLQICLTVSMLLKKKHIKKCSCEVHTYHGKRRKPFWVCKSLRRKWRQVRVWFHFIIVTSRSIWAVGISTKVYIYLYTMVFQKVKYMFRLHIVRDIKNFDTTPLKNIT